MKGFRRNILSEKCETTNITPIATRNGTAESQPVATMPTVDPSLRIEGS